MMSWEEQLSPEERREWERFVETVRRDALQKIAGSSVFLSLCPPGEPDIKFAVELGLAIMLDKPIVAVANPGRPVPGKLRAVCDEVVELEHDLDTTKGAAEVGIVSTRRTCPALLVDVGDLVEDDCGESRRVADVETIGSWVVLKDGAGDALIVRKHQEVRVMTGATGG